MRRTTRGLLGVATTIALSVGALQLPAAASSPSHPDAPPTDSPTAKAREHALDDLPNPFGDKQREMRKKAVADLLRGKAKMRSKGDSKVVRAKDGSYLEMAQEGTDQIFTILSEFGDKIHPDAGGDPGPRRNEIPKPDPKRNNSTYWTEDFNAGHYADMFFGDDGETMRGFYEAQSQGRYSIDGEVSDWVQLDYNEARYGSNELPDEADGYGNYVKDTAQAWYDAQVAAGKTKEQIQKELARFDQWDRYDHDGDGDFNEPDGYIDHFQAIHAGEGEEAGGGEQGADAIWSHRSYAFPDVEGNSGPATNPMGGVPIGDSGIWIGDYTTEPENGGLGVFAHEYGHDLGLPDLYDTAGGDNGVSYWSVMASGSWLSHKDAGAIGTTPNYMGAWEKLQLGWLDYEVASPNQKSTHTVGLSARSTDDPQALVVPLPKEDVTTDYNEPYSGSYEWWSGSGDDLNNMLRRELDLSDAKSAKLTTKAWYDIEKDYDFFFAQVSPDGGKTWEKVGDSVTGSSEDKWVDLSFDLSKYAGKKILFQFKYRSDGAVSEPGAFLDDLRLSADGEEVFFDDVEDGAGDWDPRGFTRMNGSVTEPKGKYYLAENRRYVDYDTTLRSGPYNFNRRVSKPDWVQRFPYQDGLLVWQWDEAQEDNNTSQHPGEGLILPVDANPAPNTWDNGEILRNRFQSYDATFGKERTDAFSLDSEVQNGKNVQVLLADFPARAAKPAFDDTSPNAYWDESNPQNSVRVAGHGVSIRVKKESKDKSTTTLVVKPTK